MASFNHTHFHPLTPAAFHLLLALADGEKHGYAIMQAVALRTRGEVRMGPGTLYGLIKRMLADGWIEELDERPDPALDDERRRYYRLTSSGSVWRLPKPDGWLSSSPPLANRVCCRTKARLTWCEAAMKSISAMHLPRPRVLVITERVYHKLLTAYPPEFRQRYGPEMAQVFRTSCRAVYCTAGVAGVLRLWLLTLWDWAWSVARERFSSLFRRSAMNDTLSFDRQLGDLVWSLVTGLFAGYNLRQVIEAIAKEAPEPTAGAFQRLDADLNAGLSLDEGLENLLEAVPSQYLEQVIDVIMEQHRAGGNLAELLEPLVDDILQQVGSDGAFYPAMRKEAEQLGAPLPDRAREPATH